MVQTFLKKWWVESDFKAPNLPLSLRLKVSGCHYNSIYNNTWTKQVKQYSQEDYISCMTSHYLLPFFHQCHITVRLLSVSLYNPTALFILRNVDLTVAGIMKLCLWKWEYDREFTMHNMNEWTLSSRFLCVANIDVFSPAFQWYDIMTK